MAQTVEVRFKGNRRGFYDWFDETDPLRLNEPVLVEAERGLDFGWVNTVGEAALAKCGGCASCGTGADKAAKTAAAEMPGTELVATSDEPSTDRALPDAVEPAESVAAAPASTMRGKVARRADRAAVRQHEELRRGEDDVRRQVIERATAHQLAMRISDAEWQWDRGRLSIYFTADRRVDFRALVRELASKFRTRIELRQIGVRDEAARIGGVGRCGREYCCSTWLTQPGPVNLALAKDQRLSLNPAQISGGCGRLLCCLKYEHEFYVASRKRFPKEGKAVQTLRGVEKVVAVDIFRERVFLRHDEHGPRIVALLDLRDEVERAQAAAPPVADAPLPEPPRRDRQSPPGAPRRPRGGPPRGIP